MSSAAVSIHEAKSSNVGRLSYEVVVKSPDGSPLAGVDLNFDLSGDGSLSPRFSAKETRKQTDAEGTTRITWFRSSIFGRDVKATLTVSASIPDASVELVSVPPEVATTSYDIVGQHKWQ